MKKYTEMNLEELEAATRKYDRPFVALRESRPLTAAGRKTLRRLAAKAGRPRVGEGSTNLHITLEKDLVRRADAEAKRRKIGRSELIAHSLELVLAKAG